MSALGRVSLHNCWAQDCGEGVHRCQEGSDRAVRRERRRDRSVEGAAHREGPAHRLGEGGDPFGVGPFGLARMAGQTGDQGEAELLASCYRQSLLLAEQHQCQSIAFPAISCGVYGYPMEPAARIALEGRVPGVRVSRDELQGWDWPEEWPGVIYCDRYGNLCTGIPAASLATQTEIRVGNASLAHARTFSAVAEGTAFWYENAFGLVELAVNQGRADVLLELAPGDEVRVVQG